MTPLPPPWPDSVDEWASACRNGKTYHAMDNNTPKKKTSYSKPLTLSLSGEVVGSQPALFGGFIARIQVSTVGQLPDYVDVMSKVQLPLGPFEGKVRLMIEKGYVVEAK